MRSLLPYISFILLFTTSSIVAETIDIHVKAGFKAIKATGLVISASQVRTATSTNITQGPLETTVVSFNLQSNDITPDAVATAYVEDEDGNKAFGQVKSISDASQRGSYFKRPACNVQLPPTVTSPAQIYSNIGLYESLVQVREERKICLLYTSPSPRDRQKSRMPSSA